MCARKTVNCDHYLYVLYPVSYLTLTHRNGSEDDYHVLQGRKVFALISLRGEGVALRFEGRGAADMQLRRATQACQDLRNLCP